MEETDVTMQPQGVGGTEPRMAGLAIGRIVRFVEGEGSAIRPYREKVAIITKVWNNEGTVNLAVFNDGTADYGNPVEQRTSVRFSETWEGFTWHWPERA